MKSRLDLVKVFSQDEVPFLCWACWPRGHLDSSQDSSCRVPQATLATPGQLAPASVFARVVLPIGMSPCLHPLDKLLQDWPPPLEFFGGAPGTGKYLLLCSGLAYGPTALHLPHCHWHPSSACLAPPGTQRVGGLTPLSSTSGPAQSWHRALSSRSAQDAAGPWVQSYDLAVHGWCQGWADGRTALAAASLAPPGLALGPHIGCAVTPWGRRQMPEN